MSFATVLRSLQTVWRHFRRFGRAGERTTYRRLVLTEGCHGILFRPCTWIRGGDFVYKKTKTKKNPARFEGTFAKQRQVHTYEASTRKSTCEPRRRKHKRVGACACACACVVPVHTYFSLCLCLFRCVVRVNQPLRSPKFIRKTISKKIVTQPVEFGKHSILDVYLQFFFLH